MALMRSHWRVAVLAYPGIQLLDLYGPVDIFAGANEWMRRREFAKKRAFTPPYELLIASESGKPVLSSSGLAVSANLSYCELPSKIDTLIVPGSFDLPRMLKAPGVVDCIRRLAPQTRRLVSICSGTFLLAKAGVLHGRRAVTHWAGCANLGKEYPQVLVEPDAIFVRDGRIYSSAGASAGMDLALALVEEDLGRRVSLGLARWFVMYLKRPGGQSQFSVPLKAQIASRPPIKEIVDRIVSDPSADHSVDAMARAAAMSPRNFARVFLKEVHITPAAYVASVRLEAARRQLEESQDGLKTISRSCGFDSVESLRRAFRSALRITPGQYRSRFQVSRGSRRRNELDQNYR